MIGFIGTSITITTNYNSSQSMAAWDSLHSLLDYECLLFHCDWLGSDLRIGHFFRFRCPLVSTPQLNTELPNSLTTEWLNSLTNELSWTELWALLRMNEWMNEWINESSTRSSFITRGEQNIDHHPRQSVCHCLPTRHGYVFLASRCLAMDVSDVY
jgi:hypothetical protein